MGLKAWFRLGEGMKSRGQKMEGKVFFEIIGNPLEIFIAEVVEDKKEDPAS